MNHHTIFKLLIVLLAVFLSLGTLTGIPDQIDVKAQPSLARLEVWNGVYGSNITDLSLTSGTQITVEVNVTGAGRINGFDVTMKYYNLTTGSRILDAVGSTATLGGGLFDPDNPPSGCSQVFVFKNEVDVPQGNIRVAAVLFGGCGVGDGTLFTLTFDVVGIGAAAIDIVQTDTGGNSLTLLASSGTSVPYDALGAYFRNKPGIPPVADFVFYPVSPAKGDTVTFDATPSFDPNNYSNVTDKGIRRYSWNFGDGSQRRLGEGQVQNHTFVAPPVTPISGNFSVTLIVFDYNDGLASRKTTIVEVEETPSGLPVADFIFSPISPRVGDNVTFDASVSHDPNGFIVKFIWIFGDGGGADAGDNPVTMHTYNSVGRFIVTLTVEDNNGNRDTVSYTVTVSSSMPPIADFIYSPAFPVQGVSVFFDGSRSNDPDGFVVSWFWDFGDGSVSFGTFVSHTYFSPGNYTVLLTVTDDQGATGSKTTTVHVRSRPTHDVAVVSVNVYTTRAVSGQYVNINVVLSNKGLSTETVDVTTYYDSNVAGTLTGLVLNTDPFPRYFNIVWDTEGVGAGNYTISATAFLTTDENPADNTFTDGMVEILPPPRLTVSPDSGGLGTTITVRGSGFPPSPYGGLQVVLVSFEDRFMGYAFVEDGEFTFVFNLPHADPGIHKVKAFDTFSGAHATADFLVLESGPVDGPGARLDVSVVVGAVYFPSETADIYVLVTLDGSPVGPEGLQLDLVLIGPGGSRTSLSAQYLSLGVFKASFAVPRSGSLGTYAILAQVQHGDVGAAGLGSFEVKQSWISAQSPRIASATAIVGVVAAVAVAWQKGYFRRKTKRSSDASDDAWGIAS